MRTLADAAVEGLVICDRDTIVTVNTSFAALTGFAPADLIGLPLSRCIPDRIVLERLMLHPNRIFETELDTRSDGIVPVELIMHGISFAGRSHPPSRFATSGPASWRKSGSASWRTTTC